MPAPAHPAGQSDLWARLLAFDLDGAEALSFARRLARDNNWNLDFARRVVLEYKKFVFLAATCGHPVTPSDEVDQAWHLHLVYTRSYWDELCGQVLGFALHHGPTRGGAAEGRKFRDWYAQTLQAYQTAFGAAPPADIWPAAARRFGEAPHFRRVSLRRYLLLPRPRWPRLRGQWGWLLGAGTLALVGCTARLPLNPLNWYGPEFLALYWALCLTVLPLALWLRRRGSGPAQPYEGPALTTYEVARLAGAGGRVATAALAALVYAGQLELLPGPKVKRTEAPAPTDPYERAIWNLVIPTGWSDLAKVRKQALNPITGALQQLNASLESKGLLLAPAERQRLDQIPQWACRALGAFGLVKMGVGVARDRPVGLLFLSLLGLILYAVVSQHLGRAWPSGRGRQLLRELEEQLRQDQSRSPLSAPMVALSVAFFGLSELDRLGLGSMATLLTPVADYGSGDGSGSSDGGSDGGDGGSGCGGCGGCGGGGD